MSTGAETGSALRREGWTVPIDRVAAFISGSPISVEPEQIEAELARFWQRATERARREEGRLLVSRATLWNLVVCVRGEAAFLNVKTVLDEVALTVPARVIVLYTHRARGSGETPIGGSSDDAIYDDEVPLRAFIEANVRDNGPVREVLGEEITLEAPHLESQRLPGLMRALLLPDLPTALYVAGPLPEGVALATALPVVADADRLIVDSGAHYQEAGLSALLRALPQPGKQGGPREITDLGWLRLSAWRQLLASLFDPPAAREALRDLQEIWVRYSAEIGAPRAYLLAGWLSDRLGLAPVGRDGEVVLLAGAAGAAQIRLRIAPGAARHSPAGIDEVSFVCGSQVLTARGAGGGDTRCVELLSPGAPRRVQPVHGRPDGEILTAALHTPGRDPLLYRALCQALRLLEPGVDTPGCALTGHPR